MKVCVYTWYSASASVHISLYGMKLHVKLLEAVVVESSLYWTLLTQEIMVIHIIVHVYLFNLLLWGCLIKTTVSYLWCSYNCKSLIFYKILFVRFPPLTDLSARHSFHKHLTKLFTKIFFSWEDNLANLCDNGSLFFQIKSD